jgi:hypothetical protein
VNLIRREEDHTAIPFIPVFKTWDETVNVLKTNWVLGTFWYNPVPTSGNVDGLLRN